MAGEWIKVRTNLWDDPRIARICDLTGAGEAAVIGGLYWLWATADEHTESGHMPGLSAGAIDRKTGVKGLGAALIAVQWIEDTEGGVTIMRFDEHNGTSAKNRATTAKRVAKHAANTRAEARANAAANDGPNSANAPTVSVALAREEKRREEESTTSTPDGVDATSEAGSPPSSAGKPGSKAECPHQEIIALYHEILPQCPRIRDWTPARQQHLRARWNEDPQRQSLAYWRRFFQYVETCDFLVGRSGKTPFFADLEWIVKSQNFTKIREEKYANRSAP